jgi:hypothetical protein
MPRYIVDKNVLSNGRDAVGNPAVAEWFWRDARRIGVSVATEPKVQFSPNGGGVAGRR